MKHSKTEERNWIDHGEKYLLIEWDRKITDVYGVQKKKKRQVRR